LKLRPGTSVRVDNSVALSRPPDSAIE